MSEWETYWRAGYTVAGASDVVVTEYARSQGIAEREAREGAEEDISRLIALGIALKVEFWTQRWRTRRVEERDKRSVFDTTQTARRAEVKIVREMSEA